MDAIGFLLGRSPNKEEVPSGGNPGATAPTAGPQQPFQSNSLPSLDFAVPGAVQGDSRGVKRPHDGSIPGNDPAMGPPTAKRSVVIGDDDGDSSDDEDNRDQLSEEERKQRMAELAQKYAFLLKTKRRRQLGLVGEFEDPYSDQEYGSKFMRADSSALTKFNKLNLEQREAAIALLDPSPNQSGDGVDSTTDLILYQANRVIQNNTGVDLKLASQDGVVGLTRWIVGKVSTVLPNVVRTAGRVSHGVTTGLKIYDQFSDGVQEVNRKRANAEQSNDPLKIAAQNRPVPAANTAGMAIINSSPPQSTPPIASLPPITQIPPLSSSSTTAPVARTVVQGDDSDMEDDDQSGSDSEESEEDASITRPPPASRKEQLETLRQRRRAKPAEESS